MDSKVYLSYSTALRMTPANISGVSLRAYFSTWCTAGVKIYTLYVSLIFIYNRIDDMQTMSIIYT